MSHLFSSPDNLFAQDYKRVFLVGIGGISMSGLAEIALAAGHVVAGSDMQANERTSYLAVRGVTVHFGHDAAHIDSFRPDLVVYTAAVHDDNVELIRARQLGLKVIDRAEFLGWLNREFTAVVNIAGTHGKTTTTAMCSLMLMEAGVNPTVHLGAVLHQFASTVHIGAPGHLLVSEACEYMNGYHKFFSTTAAVLNIDYDHVDCFSGIDDVIASFAVFAAKLAPEGNLIVPSFDANVAAMLKLLSEKQATAGRSLPAIKYFGSESDLINGQKPDYFYRNLQFSDGLPAFDVWINNTFFARISLKVPGLHNVHNALAAIACAHLHGCSAPAAARSLAGFTGAEGRFTETGYYRGARVIADYAHHPAAARATLSAAANIPHNHTWVVFQPLTYSRAEKLFDEFVTALKDCELVIFSEVYSDRDKSAANFSSRLMADKINELGGNAFFAESFSAIRKKLDQVAGDGDLILILGPENIRGLADQLTGRGDSGVPPSGASPSSS